AVAEGGTAGETAWTRVAREPSVRCAKAARVRLSTPPLKATATSPKACRRPSSREMASSRSDASRGVPSVMGSSVFERSRSVARGVAPQPLARFVTGHIAQALRLDLAGGLRAAVGVLPLEGPTAHLDH